MLGIAYTADGWEVPPAVGLSPKFRWSERLALTAPVSVALRHGFRADELNRIDVRTGMLLTVDLSSRLSFALSGRFAASRWFGRTEVATSLRLDGGGTTGTANLPLLSFQLCRSALR